MLVRVVTSFASVVNGEVKSWPVDWVGELPAGADWLRHGWVVPVESENIAAAFAAFADELSKPVEDKPAKPAAKKRAKKAS